MMWGSGEAIRIQFCNCWHVAFAEIAASFGGVVKDVLTLSISGESNLVCDAAQVCRWRWSSRASKAAIGVEVQYSATVFRRVIVAELGWNLVRVASRTRSTRDIRPDGWPRWSSPGCSPPIWPRGEEERSR